MKKQIKDKKKNYKSTIKAEKNIQRSKIKEEKELRKANIKDAKNKFKSAKSEKKRSYLAAVKAIYESIGKPLPVNPPKRPLLEEIGNSVTHGVGAVFAIIAIVLMMVRADTPREFVGASVYSFGLFVMFSMSCLYHSFPHGSTVKRLFRRFDYSSIYLLIGATFAPILLAYVDQVKGMVFFIIQWAIIATGITFIGVFGPTKMKWLHWSLYVVLGWSGLMFIPDLYAGDGFVFLGWILGGGIIYSIGILPFALRRGPSHFIWHFFVLAGAVVQWIGIYDCIYLAVR
jgi:hemolysin III